MKRLAACLALLLLAKPALAAVQIIVVSEAGNKVAINYKTTSGERVRAFALDVTVSEGIIKAISEYHIGESTAQNPGYGIFPGNFARYVTVDATTGEPNYVASSFYTPVADANDPNALGGLNTSGVTLEMGALYSPPADDSANAPPSSGTLCKLTLSQTANVTVSLNLIRGGIVLTNPSITPTVDLTQAQNISSAFSTAGAGLSSLSLKAATDADYAEWVAVGKPTCWTFPRQCRGDADGKTEAVADGGVSYVGQADLNILVAAWEVLEPPFGPGVASVSSGICADFAHDKSGTAATGYYRVGTTDLNRLVANWLIKEAPAGPGIPADCGTTLK